MYGQTQIDTTTYVAKYINERYGKNVTPEELFQKLPWHQIVWHKFRSYAYYKVAPYYESWDDLPEPVEGMHAYIVHKENMERYQFRGGEWIDIGADSPDCYK